MLRCSKEAFSKCPTREYCGCREEATFTEDSECAKFNAQIMDQPLTNGDRIRTMTDEELANFIKNHNICDIRSHEECKISYCGVCSQCILDWLQDPAKEE